MAQIGDQVRYLNSVGGGRIVKIEGQMAYVDEDGFETPVLLKECVVVAHAGQEPSRTTFVQPKAAPKAAAPVAEKAAPAPAPAPLPVEETDGGDVMNVVIGYQPADIKRLSESGFDLYMVNDSNYFIAFTYLTKADGEGWVMRSRGVIEPNIQEFIAEVAREDIVKMDRIAVQLIAWKEGRNFDLKPAVSVEIAPDVTKFFKLHCFREGEYFDTPVLSFDIVRNDDPCGKSAKASKTVVSEKQQVDARQLERAMRSKKNADSRPKPVKKQHAVRNGVIEVDLHIDELVDTVAGLSRADMLNLQIDEFRRVMDANLGNHGAKIVFIHGKGEGVLRSALMKELKYRYKTCRVQDASFLEYGYGATQVTIP
nr:DUF2027 domain-containing protein [Bacteroides sp.]